ncbi:RNA polymerase sigma factor [Cellulophaga sp. Z1A5H]|uniref:RNA polymerase sigma factor n=1 Tax=Cellulophaga sp. Z1A5H TaxID=2687291 RepID=UPI0013FD8AAD|nr:RNA polymerase sigma factor [Cellulophaga sp. Z1A5H]
MEKVLKFQTALIEQCKANDRRAQMKLYEKYCDGMYCVVMRYLQNSDDAEDVLQESFIKAFLKIDQFKGEVTFGAWLKKIVIHKCIDFLKAKRNAHISIEENELLLVEDDDWDVEVSITIEEVRKAIHTISEKYRYVLLLYLMEGYDHSEISQILNIQETTCRTQLMRGKAYLKEHLIKNKYESRS